MIAVWKLTNPEAGGNLTNQRAETKLKFIELYHSMWSYIVVVWFISSSIDGFLDFPEAQKEISHPFSFAIQTEDWCYKPQGATVQTQPYSRGGKETS